MSDSKEQSDLERCRASSSVNTASLTDMLYRGFRNKATRDEIRKLIENDPAFDKTKRPFQSRSERMTSSVAGLRRLLELKQQHRWTHEEYQEALDLADDQTGITLHEIAFTPVLRSQGCDEQVAYWLPKCENFSILGCYAQTELGHGSNVQRLETTATFIPEDDQFELHSPTPSSTKWWIGGLGFMATHAVVQAQLLLPQQGKLKAYGPHLFILQIRSSDKHEPLPGLTIGEIGPKVHAGYASVDNGFMRFDKVRIPRSAMLSRFAHVSAKGEYSKPPHDKLSYGGMIYIRAQMISSLAWQLAKAATISIRYLHVRRQFSDDQRSPERQVITYPSVYMRVLPVLAQSYVFSAIGKDMARLYSQMSAQLKTGNTELLAETHAISSGLKSYVSTQVVDGIEVCRRACGGHGFMAAAGLGTIYATNLPAVTYEGDNFILNQQVCRAGIKAFAAYSKDRKAFRHHATPSNSYLLSLDAGSAALDPSDLASLSDALSRRAAQAVRALAEQAAKTKVWTDLSWRCASVAKAITEAFIGQRILATFEDGKEGMLVGLGAAEAEVVGNLCKLWLLNALVAASAELVEYGVVEAKQLASLRAAEDTAAKDILPHAIALTDAFGFSDFELNSSLGRADGRAYEDLYKRANETRELNLGREEYRADIQAILKLASSAREAKL